MGGNSRAGSNPALGISRVRFLPTRSSRTRTPILVRCLTLWSARCPTRTAGILLPALTRLNVVLARVAKRPPLHTRCNRGTLMTGMRWARLLEDVDCKLRRGAWYRVTHVTGLEAGVEGKRPPLALPSYATQIRATPPPAWSGLP